MSHYGSEEQVRNLLAIAEENLRATMEAYRVADARFDHLTKTKDYERDPSVRERQEKEFRELLCTLRTYKVDWVPQAKQAVRWLTDELAGCVKQQMED